MIEIKAVAEEFLDWLSSSRPLVRWTVVGILFVVLAACLLLVVIFLFQGATALLERRPAGQIPTRTPTVLVATQTATPTPTNTRVPTPTDTAAPGMGQLCVLVEPIGVGGYALVARVGSVGAEKQIVPRCFPTAAGQYALVLNIPGYAPASVMAEVKGAGETTKAVIGLKSVSTATPTPSVPPTVTPTPTGTAIPPTATPVPPTVTPVPPTATFTPTIPPTATNTPTNGGTCTEGVILAQNADGSGDPLTVCDDRFVTGLPEQYWKTHPTGISYVEVPRGWRIRLGDLNPSGGRELELGEGRYRLDLQPRILLPREQPPSGFCLATPAPTGGCWNDHVVRAKAWRP